MALLFDLCHKIKKKNIKHLNNNKKPLKAKK